MKKFIPAVLILCVISFGLGWTLKPAPAPHSDLAAIVAGMKEGDSFTLSEKELVTGGLEQRDSITPATKAIDAKDSGWWNRTFSWWGQGGPEAATQHQGMSFDKSGNIATIGANKGTGVLERFWDWVKSVFWLVVIGGFVILVGGGLLIAFNPGGIGSWVSRALGWITGPIGAIYEAIHAHVTAKAPLAALQAAVDGFPGLIDALPSRDIAMSGEGFTDGQKKTVKTIHANTHTL